MAKLVILSREHQVLSLSNDFLVILDLRRSNERTSELSKGLQVRRLPVGWLGDSVNESLLDLCKTG